MIIMKFIPEYREKVEALCKKHDIPSPTHSEIWMAIDDNDSVVAIGGIRPTWAFEPLISENPLAGKKLVDKINEVLKTYKADIIRCFTSPKNEKLFSKAGYNKEFQGQIIMEKLL